jgi:DNA-binding transcriptional regulator GbsR (MarR family)
MSNFDKLYKSIVKESIIEGADTSYSIGNELYELYTSIDPESKTRSGAKVVDVLKDILDELNDILDNAERQSDSEEIAELVRKLKMD